MSDLNFDNFKRYLDESHTEEGRKRQEEESQRILVTHGRAYDLEVEDDDGEVTEATLPPPLKRAGQTESEERDDDTPHAPSPRPSVEEQWSTWRKERGTWGHR